MDQARSTRFGARATALFRVVLSVVLAFSMTNASTAWAAPAQSGGADAAAASQGTDSAAEASGDAASGQTADAQQDETRIDISAQWSAGSLTLDEAGKYYLGEDVETDGTLYINAPEGESIEVDFNGHDATVTGKVVAGIDASASHGAVTLLDSQWDERQAQASEQQGGEAPGQEHAGLTVEVNGAEDAAAGIMYAQSSQDAEDKAAIPAITVKDLAVSVQLNTIDASSAVATHDAYGVYVSTAGVGDDADAANVVLDGCEITAQVNNLQVDEQTAASILEEYGEKVLAADESGMAAGVFTRAKGVALAADTAIAADSAGGAAELYSTVARAFELREGFGSKAVLRAYAAGNAEGTVLATLAGEFPADADSDGVESLFSDATDGGLAVARDGDVLAFAEEGAQPEDAANADAPTLLSEDGADASVLAEGDEVSEGSEGAASDGRTLIGPDIEGAQCLNDLMTYDESTGLYSAFTISSTTTTGNVFYLDGDITMPDNTASSRLYVNKSGAEITIYLNGYSIVGSAGSSSTSPLYATLCIYAASSVTVYGADKTGAFEGSIVNSPNYTATTSQNGAVVYQHSTVGDVTIHDTNLVYKGSSNLKTTFGYGVYGNSTSGEVLLDNCTVDVDMSAVTNPTSGTTASDWLAAGIYQPYAASSAQLDNCDVKVTQSSWTYNGVGAPAYAVYTNNRRATAQGTVAINGGSYSASSPNGKAYAIYGSSVSVNGYQAEGSQDVSGVSLSAQGIEGSSAVFSLDAAYPVALDAALTVIAAATDNSAFVPYALSAESSGSFTVGDGFSVPAETGGMAALTAYIGTDDATANDVGAVIASYIGESPDKPAQLAPLFANALAGTTPTVAAAQGGDIVFVLDEGSSDIPAQVTSASGEVTKYATLASAVNAASASSGSTVTLLRSSDFGIDLGVTGAAGDALTIDLNGFDVQYVNMSGYLGSATVSNLDGQGAPRSTGGIVGVSGLYSATTYSAVYLNTAGSLTLDGVNIAYGAVSGTCYSIYNRAGGALTLKNGSLTGDHSSTVYFVYNYNASGTTTLENFDVAGTGTGTTRIVMVQAGTVNISDSDLKVTGGTTSYGVYSQGTMGATLKNVNIDLSGATSSETALYQYSSSVVSATDMGIALSDSPSMILANDNGSGTMILDGTFALSAPTLSITANSALQLGDRFELADPNAVIQITNAAAVTDDVFAQSATGRDLSALCANFAPSLASMYSGFEAQYYGQSTADVEDDDTSKLVWYHTPVAVNTTTGAEYSSLGSALSAMAEGDTVQMIEDVTLYCTTAGSAVSTAGLTINTGGTLDLNGHTVELDMSTATANGTTSTTAYQYGIYVNTSGAVPFTIADTASQKGLFAVHLGRESDYCTATKFGFSLADSASNGEPAELAIDGATVLVDYGAGEINGGDLSTLTATGISLNSSSQDGSKLTLENGAVLDVRSRADGAAVGATDVRAVYMGAKSFLSVDDSSTIKADNSSEAVWTQANVYDGSSYTDMGVSYPYLIQTDYDADSATYQRIQDAFKVQAKWDSTSRRYYAMPLVLDDDTLVWAFSDSVPADQAEGDPSNIVATEFWVQSSYQTAGNAYGVYYPGSSSYSGELDLNGTIQVTGNEANGYGLYLAVGSTSTTNSPNPGIVLGDATIDVETGEGEFRSSQGSQDFAALYGMGTDAARNAYGNFNLVSVSAPESYGYYSITPATLTVEEAAGGTPLTLDGEIAINTSGANSADIASYSLFTIGQSFSLADGQDALTVANPGTGSGSSEAGNKEGAVFAVGAPVSAIDALANLFSEDGGSAITDETAGLFADADGIYDAYVNADGALAWGVSRYDVTFKALDRTLVQYSAVSFGTVVDLPSESNIAHPPAVANTYTYEFVGWSTDPDATADTFGDSATDIPAGTSQLVVTQSAVYYAVYSETPTQRTVTFSNLHDSSGNELDDVTLQAVYGQTLGDALAAAGQTGVITSQPDYTTSEGTYRFIGWKELNSSGLAPVWDPTYQFGSIYTFTADNYRSLVDGVEFEALYVLVGEDQHLVKFYNDSLVYACAVDNGTGHATWSEAAANVTQGTFQQPTKSDLFSDDDYDYTFMGYATGKDSSSVYESSDDVDYTPADTLPASNRDQEFTVKFQQEIKTGTISLYRWILDYQGNWVYSNTTLSGIPYGTDPIDTVNDAVSYKQFVNEGNVYTLVGYSLRETDSAPIAGWESDGGSLPVMGSSVGSGSGFGRSYTLYAKYEVNPLAADVEFYVDYGDGQGAALYATAADQSSSTDINAAFAASDNPVDPSKTGYTFLGWSADPAAQGVGSYTVGTLANDAIAAGEVEDYSAITLKVYAVFQKAPTYTVTFHNDPDNPDAGTYTVGDVVEGQTVASAGALPSNPSRAGGASWFAGWAIRSADGTYVAFDPENDPVTSNLDLYAQFGTIQAVVDEGSSTTVDLSRAYLTDSEYEGAQSISFEFTSQGSVDANLTSAMGGVEGTSLGFYDVSMVARFPDGTEKTITDGFGSVTVTLPIPEAYQSNPISVYWLASDGSLQTAEGLSVQDGTVSFYVTSLADVLRGGNLAVVALPTEEQKTLEANRANALDTLTQAYDQYRSADYDSDDWSTLSGIYRTAAEAIGQSQSVSEVVSLANQAISDMAAVPTAASNSELAMVKIQYLESFAGTYGGINLADFTSESRSSLWAAYRQGVSNITSAETTEGAYQAYYQGVQALSAALSSAEPIPDAATGSGSGSTSSGGSDSGASGTSGTSGGSALSGSSGSSGLQSSGGSSLTTASGTTLSGTGGSSLESASGTGDDAEATEDGEGADELSSASGLRSFSDDSSDNGSESSDSSESQGFFERVGGFVAVWWPLILLICLVIAALIAWLVWWLIRRRNARLADEYESEFQGPASTGPAGSEAAADAADTAKLTL